MPSESALLPYEIRTLLEKHLSSSKFAGMHILFLVVYTQLTKHIDCTDMFKDEIRAFFVGKGKTEGYIEALVRLRRYTLRTNLFQIFTYIRQFGLLECDMPPSTPLPPSSLHSNVLNNLNRITKTQLEVYFIG